MQNFHAKKFFRQQFVSHSPCLSKFLIDGGMTYELLLEKFFSMEILHSLLYRNWSVNSYQITPFHFGKARLFPLHVTVCGKPCDRLRQKPRQTR